MVGNKEKIEELFATWLAQNAPSAHLSELYFCYSEIEAYCLKIKVLRKPLFETIDLDIIKRVQKTVTESRIFQLLHIQSQFHFHTLGMNRLVSLIGRNYM